MRAEFLPPVRLSVRPIGGQGQPYGDDVVALARELSERTTLTRREIAARVGVSHMTITRWARSGHWHPLGWLPRGRKPGRSWAATERDALRVDPWGDLYEAERLLGSLEQQATANLDEIERALHLVLTARAASRRPVARPKRQRD